MYPTIPHISEHDSRADLKVIPGLQRLQVSIIPSVGNNCSHTCSGSVIRRPTTGSQIRAGARARRGPSSLHRYKSIAAFLEMNDGGLWQEVLVHSAGSSHRWACAGPEPQARSLQINPNSIEDFVTELFNHGIREDVLGDTLDLRFGFLARQPV
jgi:hypothetical protein